LDKLNYKIFLEKFERDYNKNRAELRDFLKEKTKDSFSSKIWQDAVAEYGMGPGYKNRVFDLYKTVFSKFANTVHVNDAFNNEWDEIIKDNALGR
jgi:hypothetical protein